jgi:outer membrane lipoprotein SlyB
MEQQKAPTHPILLAAGVAVLIFSIVGTAAITGILPTANTKPGEPVAVAQRSAGAQSGTAPQDWSGQKRIQVSTPCPECGVINTIQPVELKGKTTGLGAVAGGVAGGLLGNQIGHGNTRTVMTVGGAAGGAFAGNAIEGNVNKRTAWRVTVRMEDGSVKTLSQSAPPPFAVGERVRIVNGTGLERA